MRPLPSPVPYCWISASNVEDWRLSLESSIEPGRNFRRPNLGCPNYLNQLSAVKLYYRECLILFHFACKPGRVRAIERSRLLPQKALIIKNSLCTTRVHRPVATVLIHPSDTRCNSHTTVLRHMSLMRYLTDQPIQMYILYYMYYIYYGTVAL